MDVMTAIPLPATGEAVPEPGSDPRDAATASAFAALLLGQLAPVLPGRASGTASPAVAGEQVTAASSEPVPLAIATPTPAAAADGAGAGDLTPQRTAGPAVDLPIEPRKAPAPGPVATSPPAGAPGGSGGTERSPRPEATGVEPSPATAVTGRPPAVEAHPSAPTNTTKEPLLSTAAVPTTPAAPSAAAATAAAAGTTQDRDDKQLPTAAAPIAAASGPASATATEVTAGPTAAPAAAATPEGAVAAQLAHRVSSLRHHDDGSYELSVDLEPADLGRIRVSVTLEGGVVHLQVGAESGGTHDLLKRALPDLRAALEEAGLSTGQLDVGDQLRRDRDQAAGMDHGDHGEPSERARPAPAPTPTNSSGASRGVDVLL